MSEPLHHLHKRKRIHEHSEQYPHPQFFKRYLDKTIYFLGIVAPLMGSLQSYKIWSEQNASGISIPVFTFLACNSVIWVTYGIVHKEKPIMIMYTLWFFVNTSIVAGAVLYG